MEEKKGAGDMPRCLIIAVSMCFFVGMYLIALAVVLVVMIVLRIANGRVLTVTGDTTMANDFKSVALEEKCHIVRNVYTGKNVLFEIVRGK